MDKNRNKTFIHPEMVLIEFNKEDVITTSALTDAGVGGEVGTDGDGEHFGA